MRRVAHVRLAPQTRNYCFACGGEGRCCRVGGVRGLVICLSRGSEPVRARAACSALGSFDEVESLVLRTGDANTHPHSWTFAPATSSAD